MPPTLSPFRLLLGTINSPILEPRNRAIYNALELRSGRKGNPAIGNRQMQKRVMEKVRSATYKLPESEQPTLLLTILIPPSSLLLQTQSAPLSLVLELVYAGRILALAPTPLRRNQPQQVPTTMLALLLRTKYWMTGKQIPGCIPVAVG